MKNLILRSIMVLCFSIKLSAQKADDVLGTWLTASGKAKVQIYKTGEKYFGKIVWLKNPTYEDGTQKVDKNNPDKSKQTTPLMGLNMLKDFVFDDDEWEDGTIYDPENGKTYSCNMKLKSGNDGMLDVRGYVGISMIGRTQTWIRIPEAKK